MNKEKLVSTLVDYVLKCPIGEKQERSLEIDLFELANRRKDQVILPPNLPAESDDAIPILRELYRDDVTKISLILSHQWPEDYLFFRVNSLTGDLFKGLEFLAEAAPELDLPFPSLRQNAFDDYLLLNDQLWEFGEFYFGDDSKLSSRIYAFIYLVVPWLFVESSEYNRYWICHTKRDIQTYDDEVRWTGRKDMRPGDLVFMYESAPTKAVRTILQVEGWPYLDPWGPWDGIWVNLRKLAEVPAIPFSWMRKNAELSDWSVVRRQFQGVITEPVPHACYNELINQIPTEILEKHELQAEPVSSVSCSGEFATEAQFEDDIIDPLLRSWGISFLRQYAVKCHFGTQRITGYVDFLFMKDNRPVGLLENKLRILSEQELRAAINQAKSYSLMLGLACFVIGSPEGLKLYQLNGTSEEILSEWTIGAKSEEEAFRRELLRLAGI